MGVLEIICLVVYQLGLIGIGFCLGRKKEVTQ